jgi:hypothetical protein
MESDAFYLNGADVEDVERAMNRKLDEIRQKGGEVENVSFTVTTANDQPWAEARFDYRLPADEIGEEVEFDPDSVEDVAE